MLFKLWSKIIVWENLESDIFKKILFQFLRK